ncbi:MAG: ABC transporter permease [Rhodospirillales bacterium]|nr:ABC transporter permease [Rhodospirillales bacterium]
MTAPPSQLIWKRFCQHRLAVVSAATLILLIFISGGAPLWVSAFDLDGQTVDLFNRFQPVSAAHPLGTDELGRDVLARLIKGGRVSLFVGLTAALFASVIGTTIGLMSGYFGGRIDMVIMRFTDGVISLPLLPLLIVLAAIDLSKLGLPDTITNSENASLYRISIIVALAGWTTVARLVRAETLALRERTFVKAAQAQGATSGRIMRVHILPNLAASIIVATTLSAGNIILLESVLSFLGLGIQPPVTSWGNLLTNAQELIWDSPRLAFYPGALIFLTVIAFNFLGDGLRDAIDPKTLTSDK